MDEPRSGSHPAMSAVSGRSRNLKQACALIGCTGPERSLRPPASRVATQVVGNGRSLPSVAVDHLAVLPRGEHKAASKVALLTPPPTVRPTPNWHDSFGFEVLADQRGKGRPLLDGPGEGTT